jgi:hypothetical protein
MSSVRQSALRKVAEATLERHCGQLDPALKQELATSLARQWITNDGHAGLITRASHCWFRMVRKGSGFEVGFDAQPPRFVDDLRRMQVDEEEIPVLLHQLNLCQSVWFQVSNGETWQLRMVARERRLLIEPVCDGEG